MMRSIVTKPLLTNVQRTANAAVFDVIIALNEQFRGGTAAALAQVQQRAIEWSVQYSHVASYVFARLTKELIVKILSLLGLPTRGPPRAPGRRVDLFQTI